MKKEKRVSNLYFKPFEACVGWLRPEVQSERRFLGLAVDSFVKTIFEHFDCVSLSCFLFHVYSFEALRPPYSHSSQNNVQTESSCVTHEPPSNLPCH